MAETKITYRVGSLVELADHFSKSALRRRNLVAGFTSPKGKLPKKAEIAIAEAVVYEHVSDILRRLEIGEERKTE